MLQVAATGKLCALTAYRGARGKRTNLLCGRGAPNPPRARVLRALRGVGRRRQGPEKNHTEKTLMVVFCFCAAPPPPRRLL